LKQEYSKTKMEGNVNSLQQAHLLEVLDLVPGDIIRVEGPGGWSSVIGQVTVKKITAVNNDENELMDVTVTVKKLNRSQELPSACAGGYYFSAAQCTVKVTRKFDGATVRYVLNY
jgi:hypothetical protein